MKNGWCSLPGKKWRQIVERVGRGQSFREDRSCKNRKRKKNLYDVAVVTRISTVVLSGGLLRATTAAAGNLSLLETRMKKTRTGTRKRTFFESEEVEKSGSEEDQPSWPWETSRPWHRHRSPWGVHVRAWPWACRPRRSPRATRRRPPPGASRAKPETFQKTTSWSIFPVISSRGEVEESVGEYGTFSLLAGPEGRPRPRFLVSVVSLASVSDMLLDVVVRDGETKTALGNRSTDSQTLAKDERTQDIRRTARSVR